MSNDIEKAPIKKQNPDPEKPQLPQWRAFKITRYNPRYSPSGAVQAGSSDHIEEVMVAAHSLSFEGQGAVAFISYIEKDGSVYQTMPRVFNSWIDVEEIVTSGVSH